MSDTAPTPTHTAPPIPTKFTPEDTFDLISDIGLILAHMISVFPIDPEGTKFKAIRAHNGAAVEVSIVNALDRGTAYLDQNAPASSSPTIVASGTQHEEIPEHFRHGAN